MSAPGSSFCRRLAAALERHGRRCAVLSVDAPLEGLPVTIARDRVTWEGVDLLGAGAIFVERPLYAWPQAQRPETTGAAAPRKAGAEREARSLALSALLVAAGRRRVVNPPESWTFAAAPATALEHLAAAGSRVHAWELAPAPEPGAERGRLVLDAVGPERWHGPSRPPRGEPCLMLEPVEGEVLGVLVVGGEAAGARRAPSAAAWLDAVSTANGDKRTDGDLVAARAGAAAAESAVAAAARLGVETALVWLAGPDAGAEVLYVDVGPDLDAWDTVLQGAASAALARCLTGVAAS